MDLSGDLVGAGSSPSSPPPRCLIARVVYTSREVFVSLSNDSIPAHRPVHHPHLWVDGRTGPDHIGLYPSSRFQSPRDEGRRFFDDHYRRSRGNPRRETLSPAGIPGGAFRRSVPPSF